MYFVCIRFLCSDQPRHTQSRQYLSSIVISVCLFVKHLRTLFELCSVRRHHHNEAPSSSSLFIADVSYKYWLTAADVHSQVDIINSAFFLFILILCAIYRSPYFRILFHVAMYRRRRETREIFRVSFFGGFLKQNVTNSIFIIIGVVLFGYFCFDELFCFGVSFPRRSVSQYKQETREYTRNSCKTIIGQHFIDINWNKSVKMNVYFLRFYMVRR